MNEFCFSTCVWNCTEINQRTDIDNETISGYVHFSCPQINVKRKKQNKKFGKQTTFVINIKKTT